MARFNLEQLIAILKRKGLYEGITQEIASMHEARMDIDDDQKGSLDKLLSG